MNKDFDLENEFVTKPKMRKINYKIIALVGVLVIFCALSWYLYQVFAPDEEVYDIPLIESDSEITKIKPLDPGGVEVSNMDKVIYNNIAQNDTNLHEKERLLPPPEEPIITPNTENDKSANAFKENPEDNLDELLKPIAEEFVKAEDVKGNMIDDHAIASNPKASNEKNSENLSTAVSDNTLINQVEIVSNELTSTEFTDENSKKSEVVIAKKKSLVKAMSKKNQPIIGKYKIQLASMKSEKDAAREWLRLKAKYKQHIGNLSYSLEKRNVAGKGNYHCIHAGAFKNYNSAHTVCKQLISKKQHCIVIENK